MDSLGEGPVGAGNPGVVTLDAVVGDDLECLAGLDLDGLVIDEEACTDLRSLRVQHDRARLVRTLLQSLFQVGNGPTVSLIDKKGATRIESGVETGSEKGVGQSGQFFSKCLPRGRRERS